ncbi:hypothetical protein, partial [Acinetobacter variabilis]
WTEKDQLIGQMQQNLISASA